MARTNFTSTKKRIQQPNKKVWNIFMIIMEALATGFVLWASFTGYHPHFTEIGFWIRLMSSVFVNLIWLRRFYKPKKFK
ncbi:MAG: hypothetical protein MRECE_24c022 [Mycoplasmataceae bacterium CE_OT135]|nr:MAG: hypothetical protein MRECE_24c022 [Mycoplasmataceae bacterium CE_OT135]